MIIPQITHVAWKKKLFDEPNYRKLNKKVIPTMGGIGIFIGFTVSSALAMHQQLSPGIPFIYAASLIMLFTGLKDDMVTIPARKKFLIQMGTAGMLVTLGNFRVDYLYGLFTIGYLPDWASIPLTFLIFLFLINAFNLIDGIDGLAGGLACMISGFLGIWFLMAGHMDYAVLSFALCGSLIAFLRFNLSEGKNKIFMGDTGSLLLGVIIAALIVKYIHFNLYVPKNLYLKQAPLFALALLIVPATDTLRVFMIRLFNGKSPFTPDMNHIHHILIKAGLSHLQASSFLILYTLSFLLLAISLQSYLPLTINFSLFLILSFGTVEFLSLRNQTTKRVHRPKMVVLKNHDRKEEIVPNNIRWEIEPTLGKAAVVTKNIYKN
jgi:UDP-N-acetylmuramyl pentapeptide phosphotransferase/UDP-N-acetylglucosamine-1-phosphate transferase